MAAPTLESRIARLETSARRWKLATFSLLLLGIASLSVGGIVIGSNTGGMQAPMVTADKLVANKSITLNDADGNPRIILSNEKNAPALAIKDKDDHTLFAITVEKDAAYIEIKNAAGKKLFSAP